MQNSVKSIRMCYIFYYDIMFQSNSSLAAVVYRSGLFILKYYLTLSKLRNSDVFVTDDQSWGHLACMSIFEYGSVEIILAEIDFNEDASQSNWPGIY